MKEFLKIVLIILAAVIAFKLLPLALAIGCLLAGALVIALALGASFVAVALPALLVLAAVLTPIWLPLLALIGLVALLKGPSRNGVARG